MSRVYTVRLRVSGVLVSVLCTLDAFGQQGPQPGGTQGTVTVPTPTGDIIMTPGMTTQVPVYIPPPGYPAPGVDINPGLPSSSRPSNNTSSYSDTFDLDQRGAGGNVVHGEKNAEGITTTAQRSVSVPPIHQVRPGDTLWDLCNRYYGNPYNWPRVWSYNPQLENPHWIYPGDQLRMREGATPADLAAFAGPAGEQQGGLISRRPAVTRDTIFLRTQGLLADANKDVWGEVVGASEDQMLLSEGNHIYMSIRPETDVRAGQTLTLFRTREQPEVKDARRPPGEIVAIKGTVRVDNWNPTTRIARGTIIESVDVVERGAKVGPVGRRLEVIAVRPNGTDLLARVLTSIYPHVNLVQNQVVFIDRGSEDGLVPGNRLFVVKKGDAWRQSLVLPTRAARERPVIDSPKNGPIEPTPMREDDAHFPDEVIGELRVLRTERYSALALVTASIREIAPGDRAVAKKGY